MAVGSTQHSLRMVHPSDILLHTRQDKNTQVSVKMNSHTSTWAPIAPALGAPSTTTASTTTTTVVFVLISWNSLLNLNCCFSKCMELGLATFVCTFLVLKYYKTEPSSLVG